VFHWKFIIYLQIKDTFHLIATEKAKTHPLWKPIYNLFTEINAPHLIGQKSGNFPPLWRKVYILFTEFSSLYLHCQKNRPFDNRISKNLSPHLYTKNRGFEGVFWKMLYSFFTKTKVSSSNRTKKWQNTPLAMKGLRFVYKNQYSSSNRTKNSRFEGCSTENL
jgi:hypothetical protein